MPYTKAQIVSGKYIIGFLVQLTMLIVTGAAQAVKLLISGDFIMEDFAVLMLLMLIVSTLTSSISLPFIFKLGVEKGRLAYYVMVAFVCGASALAANLYQGQFGIEMKPNFLLAVLATAGIGIYILSWYLSVVFYQKREF